MIIHVHSLLNNDDKTTSLVSKSKIISMKESWTAYGLKSNF